MPRRNAPSPPSKGARRPRCSKKHLSGNISGFQSGNLDARGVTGESKKFEPRNVWRLPTHARTRRPVGTSTYDTEGTVRLDEEEDTSVAHGRADSAFANRSRPRHSGVASSARDDRTRASRPPLCVTRRCAVAPKGSARAAGIASAPAVSKRFSAAYRARSSVASGCTKAMKSRISRPRPSAEAAYKPQRAASPVDPVPVPVAVAVPVSGDASNHLGMGTPGRSAAGGRRRVRRRGRGAGAEGTKPRRTGRGTSAVRP